ncbi:hypothetical protein SLEP1_g28452 [Rubroshorea leprosula]|uniref:Uncharacterized protein n=1 Tax=Rubroshorea leprosula TaxID=152421 RepID=A0AAV5K368_9ROSI|nr:hypothetical protein SLEP1_g28452 [Rubroshorea leprosula]
MDFTLHVDVWAYDMEGSHFQLLVQYMTDIVDANVFILILVLFSVSLHFGEILKYTSLS